MALEDLRIFEISELTLHVRIRELSEVSPAVPGYSWYGPEHCPDLALTNFAQWMIPILADYTEQMYHKWHNATQLE